MNEVVFVNDILAIFFVILEKD